MIKELRTGKAAEAAGLLVGDAITAVGGMPTNSKPDFMVIMSHAFPGETEAFTVSRAGNELEVSVQFGAANYSMKQLQKLRAIAGLEWCKAHDMHHVHEVNE